jgi:hypothetical protein
LGRKSWLFAGSERGAEHIAVMYTPIQTAKLNDVDPQGWLADVLARIAGQAMSKLDELLRWNWDNPKRDDAAKGSDHAATAMDPGEEPGFLIRD